MKVNTKQNNVILFRLQALTNKYINAHKRTPNPCNSNAKACRGESKVIDTKADPFFGMHSPHK